MYVIVVLVFGLNYRLLAYALTRQTGTTNQSCKQSRPTLWTHQTDAEDCYIVPFTECLALAFHPSLVHKEAQRLACDLLSLLHSQVDGLQHPVQS